MMNGTKEKKSRKKRSLELNENTTQNLRDTFRVVLQGKPKALSDLQNQKEQKLMT